MIKLFKEFKWYYGLLVLVIIALVYAQVTLDLMLPDYMNEIVTEITLAYSGLVHNTDTIWSVGSRMILVVIVSMICTMIVGFLASIIAAGFSKDIREKIFRKVEGFSFEEIDTFSTASLITRTTNDVRQIQMVVVMFLRLAVSAPLMGVKAIMKAVDKSSTMSGLMAIAVIALVLAIVTIFIIVVPKFTKMQKLTDQLNLVTRENLTGLRVVRASNAEAIEEKKFNDVNDTITKNNIFVNRVVSLMQPTIMLTMNGVSLAIVWVGATLINRNQIAIGDMIEFQQYAIQVVMAFMMITMLGIFLPRGLVSGKRIQEILATKTKINDPLHPVTQFHEQGTIEFKNVSFAYPGSTEPVLENINFKIQQGQTIAIIGSTGSGKSTIINLIPRFFDVTSGEVCVNGVNVKQYRQQELRDLIGYVPQKGILFSGTIASNLQLGKSQATTEELKEAIFISQAEEFVSKLEQGLEYPIAQGGSNVSGGQKQRLSIARAIIKKPEIYIFDDSFSALDFKTERVLRQTLEQETKGTTKLIVAQRVGSIMNADQIIVLEKGKIVGIGKHTDLLETCEVYQEIAQSQLSKEELSHA
jgi:ATP-binding cassette, subfamily B, multidrug efflux pump